MKKINLFLITLMIITMSFGFFCSIYGSEKKQGYQENFYIELSETNKFTRLVTAIVKPIRPDQYSSIDHLTYYWDCEAINTNYQGGTRYTFNTNGNHTVKIYSGKNGYPEHLEDMISVYLNNVDNTAPQIGNISAEMTDGKWKISLEECTDNCTSSSFTSMCMTADQASNFREGRGWNEDRLRKASGWSYNMSYEIDEGTYCLFLMDEAGNIAEKDYHTGHHDGISPVFTGDPIIENEGCENGYTHAVLITVNAEDNEKMNAYPYSFNGGKTWQEGNQLRVVENGVVEVKARDWSGNESEALMIEISNIDNEPPIISLTQKEDSRNDGSVEITVVANDSLSGVSELSYQNDAIGIPVIISGGDGSSSESRGTSVTINQNGSYTFFASDILGNISSSAINVVKAVKTEYRDAGDKPSGTDPLGSDNENRKNTEKNSSKNSDKKNKNKKSDKKDNGSSGKTTIINPGSGSKEAIGSGSYTAASDSAATENKIVIKDSATPNNEKGSSENSGKVKKSSSSSHTITVSSPSAAGNRKSGIGTYSLYEDDISGLDSNTSSDEDQAETSGSPNQPEIKEVTLDEYLAAPGDEKIHEEEISPELLESEDNSGKKTGMAGKILMTCVILIILAVLTLLLLISKGIISLPEIDTEDDDDEDNNTGELSIFDRIRGVLTK